MTGARKEAIRAYKERTIARGIFAVRCTETGETWVGSAPNLDGAQNRIWFSLRHGILRNPSTQAAWDAHGEPSFQFEILEVLDEDIPALLLTDALKKRKKHCMGQLNALAV